MIWPSLFSSGRSGEGEETFCSPGSVAFQWDLEPVVWLAEGVQRPPIPQPQQGTAGRPKRKDEFHLAEVHDYYSHTEQC